MNNPVIIIIIIIIIYTNVPRWDRSVDERRIGAPAERVAVVIGLLLNETLRILQMTADVRVCFLDMLPNEVRHFIGESSVGIHGARKLEFTFRRVADDRVGDADPEIIFAESGGLVNDPSPSVVGDVLVADHAERVRATLDKVRKKRNILRVDEVAAKKK